MKCMAELPGHRHTVCNYNSCKSPWSRTTQALNLTASKCAAGHHLSTSLSAHLCRLTSRCHAKMTIQRRVMQSKQVQRRQTEDSNLLAACEAGAY